MKHWDRKIFKNVYANESGLWRTTDVWRNEITNKVRRRRIQWCGENGRIGVLKKTPFLYLRKLDKEDEQR